jgi:hypothetical protein
MASNYVDDNDNFGHSDKIDSDRTNQIMLISHTQAGQSWVFVPVHTWTICIRVAQNPKTATNLFSNLFMGIFCYQENGKYKQQIHRMYHGFAQRSCFLTQKYKGFSNSTKGNLFRYNF